MPFGPRVEREDIREINYFLSLQSFALYSRGTEFGSIE